MAEKRAKDRAGFKHMTLTEYRLMLSNQGPDISCADFRKINQAD